LANSVRVLVVDDEILIHPSLQDTLEEGGYAVQTASSAEEAIEMLEAPGAAYNALVTDINLGSKITGWDVARRARELTAELPVVYMTGFAHEEWTANGVPHSVLLGKPFAPAQLLIAVSQLLNVGSAPLS
jgi:DNA-binding response OmpR family regulator